MNYRPRKLLLPLVLAISCLSFTGARAQPQYPQYFPQGPDNHQEDRERDNGQDRDWKRHHERYLGGVTIQPNPSESNEAYRNRVHAQCNLVWDQNVRRCNTLGNPYQREACVANCNNELYECKARF